MWNDPLGKGIFQRFIPRERCGHMSGLSARFCGPLASMKSAKRVTDQPNALEAQCRAGLSRLGISSRCGIIACLCTLPLAATVPRSS